MYQDFTAKNEKQIYDPELIGEFCIKAAAKTVFDNVIGGMIVPRHSHSMIQFNIKLTVSIIYNLCHKQTILGLIFNFQLGLSGTSQRVSQRARNQESVWILILFTCLAD